MFLGKESFQKDTFLATVNAYMTVTTVHGKVAERLHSKLGIRIQLNRQNQTHYLVTSCPSGHTQLFNSNGFDLERPVKKTTYTNILKIVLQKSFKKIRFGSDVN